MSKAADNITPLVLTYNEEPNIGRTLDSLRWARRVVVVDSKSSDRTEEIARSYNNVHFAVRPFDNHRAQWHYGIADTGIDTPFVLALDADMQVPPDVVDEIEKTFLSGNYSGGLLPFAYQYCGQRLAGSLCPPQIRIFRTDAVQVAQSDHTQSFTVAGEVYRFRSCLIHDDRKSLERWVESQLRYQVLNEKAALAGKHPALKTLLRRRGLMAPIVGVMAYIKAGGPFYGAAALRYAYERAIGESLFSLRLINAALDGRTTKARDNGNH